MKIRLQPKLYHVYRLGNELEAEVILPIIRTSMFQQFPLPTEHVVASAQIVIPKFARVYWSTRLFFIERVQGEIEELVGPDAFYTYARGKNIKCYSAHEAQLCELWTDRGDDGHVNYVFGGQYGLVKSSDLKDVDTFYGPVCAPVIAEVDDDYHFTYLSYGSTEGEV